MLNNIFIALKWAFSVGHKFFRVAPGVTLTVVTSTLVSQFSILLAFLLPLKILMLLGANGIPRYFPSFFSGVDREFLVVLLSFLAVVFYLVHIAAERVIYRCSAHGSNLLLEKSKKISLFENQEDVAGKAYQRYSRSLAASVFILLVAIVMACLFPELLLFIFFYAIVSIFACSFLYSLGGKFKKSLDENTVQTVSVVTNLGFLLSFGFMVVCFITGNPPSILVAIVSIITIRQGFSRLLGFVSDIKGLYGQRLKINALFFHGHVLVHEVKRHEADFWALLQSPRREVWVREVIERVCSRTVSKVELSWWQMGVPDVAAFYVKCFFFNSLEEAEFFIKLYNNNKNSLARHEATLLTSNESLPSLPLLSVEKVGSMNCHVFEWISGRKAPLNKVKSAGFNLLEELIEKRPDKELASQFKRSKPLLWQRVDDRMVDHLCIISEMAGSAQEKSMKEFREKTDFVRERLRSLPLVFVNPDKKAGSLLETEKGYLMLNWGRWSLEPLGFGWPSQPNQIQRLVRCLNESRQNNSFLREVSAENVKIAALVSSMEKAYLRQDFLTAVGYAPRILSCL